MFKPTALAVAALMISGAASAASPINNALTTSIKIVANCTAASFTSAGVISFGPLNQGDAFPAPKSDSLNFTCGLDAPYTINASGTSSRSLNTLPVNSTPIPYDLYAGTALTCSEGALLGSNTSGISGSGHGSGGQAQEICAVVGSGNTLDYSPGSYSNTVTVSLSF